MVTDPEQIQAGKFVIGMDHFILKGYESEACRPTTTSGGGSATAVGHLAEGKKVCGGAPQASEQLRCLALHSR